MCPCLRDLTRRQVTQLPHKVMIGCNTWHVNSPSGGDLLGAMPSSDSFLTRGSFLSGFCVTPTRTHTVLFNSHTQTFNHCHHNPLYRTRYGGQALHRGHRARTSRAAKRSRWLVHPCRIAPQGLPPPEPISRAGQEGSGPHSPIPKRECNAVSHTC